MNDEARNGYDAAVKFVDKEARTIWSVFTALLAVNAFLLSFAAFLVTYLKPSIALARGVGGLGLFVCVVWALMMMRNFDFYRYYFSWARKFEKDAFGDVVQMVRKGKDFARGDTVDIDGTEIRLRCGSKLFRAEWLIYVVIAAFAVVYAYMLFCGLPLPRP